MSGLITANAKKNRVLSPVSLAAATFLSAIFSTLALTNVAQAIPVSAEIKARLDRILLEPAYQPRSRGSWSEIIGKFLESGLRIIKNIVGEVLDWLFGHSQGGGRFLLPDWIATLFLSLGEILHIAILLAILYLLYRIIRPLLPGLSRRAMEPSVVLNSSGGRLVDLVELVEQKRWSELLAGMRIALRKNLAANYGFPDSATDREIVKTADLPAKLSGHEDLPNLSGSSLINIFRTVASSFEAAAFAGRKVEELEVIAIYECFCSVTRMTEQGDD